MGQVFLIDEGALLQKDDPEFEHYGIVYDKELGYFDDNQFYTPGLADRDLCAKEFASNLKFFIKDALETNGDYDRYFVVSEQEIDDDLSDKLEEDARNHLGCDIEIGDDDYSAENVLLSIRIKNGSAKVNFIKGQGMNVKLFDTARKVLDQLVPGAWKMAGSFVN